MSPKSLLIKNTILTNQTKIGNILTFDFTSKEIFVFDLTETNENLKNVDLNNQVEFDRFIFGTMTENNCRVGIGRYAEDRVIYRRSRLFTGEEARSLHLGIDLWLRPGEKILSPLDATVHSFQNNAGFGDYGPTIILKHILDGITFFTLYGHLSVESLEGLSVDKKIKQGEIIATVGTYEVNGNWPAHVHFEIITDLQGKSGDFPGVAKPSEREKYLDLCLDPNLLLNIPKLAIE